MLSAHFLNGPLQQIKKQFAVALNLGFQVVSLLFERLSKYLQNTNVPKVSQQTFNINFLQL